MHVIHTRQRTVACDVEHNVLSRALQRVGCSSGLCRSLKMIFPSREDQHGGMALEGSREDLCALHTKANAVVLDS